jgi:hypothetical protein
MYRTCTPLRSKGGRYDQVGVCADGRGAASPPAWAGLPRGSAAEADVLDDRQSAANFVMPPASSP